MLKKFLLPASIFLACYLIISIPFVYSYVIGNSFGTKKVRMSIFQPSLHIMDELKPVNCESSGYINFRMFIKNLPPGSNITKIEAYVTDPSYPDTKYDVSSSLLCTPTKNLISNEEISCHLNAEKLISNLPDCPMERIDNRFELHVGVQTETGSFMLFDSKKIVITDVGVEPNLRIDFQATYPPYQVPKINCLTGSKVDVPVVLEHTEVFYGEPEWYLRINESQELSELIECELVVEGDYRPEGKNDIYLCVLTVPSTFFPRCGRGSVPLEIIAKNEDYRVSDSFVADTFAQELNLGLGVGEVGRVECQIVNEEGLCIPINPQRNVSVRITGNVPKYIEAFDFSYKLGDDNETDTYCKRTRYNKYECILFVTKDVLPVPKGNGTTKKTRDLNFSMHIRHINYYQTLSGTVKVEMEGRAIYDFLNAKKALEDKKKTLENWKKWEDALEKAAWVIDFVNLCCKLVVLEKQLNDLKWLEKVAKLYGNTLPGVLGDTLSAVADSTKQFLTAVEEFGKELFIALKTLQDEVIRILKRAGPGIIGCMGDAAMKAVEKEIENIDKFENGAINKELEIPDDIDDIFSYLKSFVTCFGENFWDNIKSRWVGYVCMIAVFVINIICEGCLTQVCVTITQLSGPLDLFVTLALLVISVVIMTISIEIATQAISLAREQINVHLKGQKAVEKYMEYMRNTFLAIALAQVNAQANTLLNPLLTMDPVSIRFISGRTGLLDYDDEICKGDSLTIKYNFKKLNITGDFVPELRIQNYARPFSRTLVFPDLEGTYGPYSIDSVFRINPNNNPSSYYTFFLTYEIEGSKQTVDYRLYYNNQTCV